MASPSLEERLRLADSELALNVADVRFGSKTVLSSPARHVRSPLRSGCRQATCLGPLSATTRRLGTSRLRFNAAWATNVSASSLVLASSPFSMPNSKDDSTAAALRYGK